MSKSIKYLPFEQAREFARTLGLTSSTQWRRYSSSGQKPPNIPTQVWVVYHDKWTDWSDFLGFDPLARRPEKYLPFEQARELARTSGIKTCDDWKAKFKTSNLAAMRVPQCPQEVFKHKGWLSWRDWLGTQVGASPVNRSDFMAFHEARSIVQKQQFKSTQEFRLWVKTSRPTGMPLCPNTVYTDFISWTDWIGTNPKRERNKVYLSFCEARKFVHELGLRGESDWRAYCKSGDKPNNIPFKPERSYTEWKGWGDWVGTGNIARKDMQYKSFEDARAFLRGLNLGGYQEWKTYRESAEKPKDIPAAPDIVYKNKGWLGFANFLGYRPQAWTKPALLNFLEDLKPFIPMMDAGDLMALARQSHIPKSLIRTDGTSDGLVNRLRDLCAPDKSEQEKINEFESIQSEIANNDLDVSEGDWSDDVELFEADEPKVASTEADATLESTLTPYVGAEELKMLNGFIERYFSESETIQYLISKRVNRLWYELFHTDDFETIDKKLKDGECQLVTDAFMAEYDGANSIEVPDGFSYTNGQVRVEPNWMQKLTAWKLQERKRIGNWSGVGAGKTLSAIFAGRRLNLKTTVVIANNNTIDGWHKAITTFFPDSHVVKHNGLSSLTSNGFRYVIVNYEKFQLAKSKTLVEHLLATHPDFIVVDELQSVKNRAVETESRRRKAVNMFVQQATEQNPDLHVLGMSATPCVNNLQEIRGLLELITGKDLSHMSTRPTWANASAFHEMLVCSGLRYRPDYAKGVEPVIVPVDGAPWLKELLEIDSNPNNVLRQEQVLCKIKLEELVSSVIPGTIIYTHYVDGLVPMIKTACESAGFRVGCFTGSESELEKKESKERFLEGKYDVLIGSSAIGTGVDGLQRVCSRLIFACLPWTNAEFEQIVGRVFRQGRIIDKVDVVIPQVEISLGVDENGKPLKWSRDIERMNIILSKRTLMDCAIDGVRPTQDLTKEHKMAKKGLEAMMKRISANQDTSSLSTTSVAIDSIDDKESAVRNMGEFTVLNRRWSTMKSDTLHKQLVQKPSEWRRYHKLLSEARQTWTEIPFEVIAKQIKRRDWLVADLGCGEALFAQSVPNTVHSYDHVAINDSVIACDISNVPSSDEVYDAVVMSLVCMGANWPDYITEAHRILKPHGLLFLAEPLKGQFDQQERIDEIANSITKKGFDISSRDLSGGFVYFKALKS